MNSLFTKLFFISTILLVTLGCRKDPHIVEDPPVNSGCLEDWCDDLPPDGGLGYNYIVQGAQYLRPCFNPNNPNITT